MNLFYNPKISIESSEILFSREESKHIIKVLRKKNGDSLNITNGKGHLFNCEIINDNPNKCLVSVLKSKYFKPSDLKIHIVIAPTKNMDRIEWFLEKCTEIGITEITPLICENSERKTIKEERLNKIIVSAMKQSLDYSLPRLNPVTNYKDFVANNNDTNKFIAHCEEDSKIDLSKYVNEGEDNYTILIGPEGDFTQNEINFAKENNFKPVSLGNKRLRTETAGLVACHTINLIYNSCN